MADIKPRDVIISFSAFLLVVATMTWVVAAIASNNPASIDSEDLATFNNTFNKLSVYDTQTAELQSNVKDVVASEGIFGALNSLINQAWDALRLLFSSFSFINTAIAGLANVFGIPDFVIVIGSAVIILLFVFGVLAVIFNRDV